MLLRSLLLLIAMVSTATADDAFEFNLLIEEHRVSAELSTGLRIYSYNRQHANKWPNGGIVLVCSTNCEPCERWKKTVMVHPTVVQELNQFTFVLSNPTKWKMLQDKVGKFKTPFFVFVAPGGKMIGRAQCPMDVLRTVKGLRTMKGRIK